MPVPESMHEQIPAVLYFLPNIYLDACGTVFEFRAVIRLSQTAAYEANLRFLYLIEYAAIFLLRCSIVTCPITFPLLPLHTAEISIMSDSCLSIGRICFNIRPAGTAELHLLIPFHPSARGLLKCT